MKVLVSHCSGENRLVNGQKMTLRLVSHKSWVLQGIRGEFASALKWWARQELDSFWRFVQKLSCYLIIHHALRMFPWVVSDDNICLLNR